MHTIGGTQISDAQYNLLNKLRKHGLAVIPSTYAHRAVGLCGVAGERKNPYTGKVAYLKPLALVLHDWIVDPKRGTNISAGTESQDTWDRAKVMFRQLWEDKYYDLID